jgi:hypothetical protein
MFDSFYNNLIAEDRYRMILDGLQVTLLITVCAALDFMVENMDSTPLSDAQRSELSGQCQQVVEELTGRGFRVKLII